MVLVMNAIAQASASAITGPKLDNRRVLAALVDLAIVVAGALVILAAADALSGDRSDVQGALSAVILGWTLYYYFALESGSGQTVGKRLMKLRVVRADGRPAGMREIAVRTVLRVVDGIGAYIVGLIVMLATGQRRQRLGDLAAGTIVVDASVPAGAPPAPVEEPLEVASEDVPEAEVTPQFEQTITLPSRPAPPATLADLTAPEAPPVPELRPFDPPPAEPVVEEEPLEEEPVVEDEPVVELADEPVAEEPLPAIATPSLEELARDVAAAKSEPEAEDDPADEPEMTVKSVETVSAIDLVMGGAPEDEDSSESLPEDEDSVSQ
jgi:uncharacterized RDD family membrane protein YckC